jgi:hypothetical protein
LTNLVVGVNAEGDGGGLMSDYGLVEIGWVECHDDGCDDKILFWGEKYQMNDE